MIFITKVYKNGTMEADLSPFPPLLTMMTIPVATKDVKVIDLETIR